ncbi:beta strand repeat-containing protein [Singulisphaera sp. PoT]|uniref:beta strand repeat-containing protein n=1 Tax=Singulisphaera sp. PoT TaxID=3411797 RepID=UPI003BF4D534
MSTITGWKVLRRGIFGSSRRGRRRPGSFSPGLSVLEGRIVLSTLVVTDANDSGPGSFRQAIIDAHGGDTITFANSLRGQTITLTSGELAINKDLDIEGPGAGFLTVSGNDASRVFNVSAGVNATIAGLTITDGRSGDGGGIINRGNLSLQKSTVTANEADGTLDISGWAQGGGITNKAGGTLTISQSTISGNKSIGEDDSFIAGLGFGGGVMNESLLTIISTTISGNQAIGGASSHVSGAGIGGGIGSITVTVNNYQYPQSLQIVNSTLINNQAIGTDVPSDFSSVAGNASGGAIALGAGPTTITGTSFIGNRAIGGDGGAGFASGGAITGGGGVVSISNSSFTGNEAIAGDGDDATGALFDEGASADGGAISIGTNQMTIIGSTFTANKAIGGDAGTPSLFSAGGGASGGAISFSQSGGTSTVTIGGDSSATPPPTSTSSPGATIIGSEFTDNQVIGGRGNGGQGGQATGAAIAMSGSYAASPDFTSVTVSPSKMTIIGTTITGNVAQAGPGATGGAATGGGICTTIGSLAITGSNLSGNLALGGAGLQGGAGGTAQGGGLLTTDSTVTLTGTLVTNNQAIGGAGGDGTSGDAGGAGGNAQGGGLATAVGGLDYLGIILGVFPAPSTLTVNGGALTGNLAEGGVGGQGDGSGAGGVGGSASGGAAINSANTVLTFKSSLLSGNVALGGIGAQGAARGNALGGAVFDAGPMPYLLLPAGVLNMTDTLVVGNLADGAQGFGGGIYFDAGSVSNLTRTLVLGNRAATAGNNTYNA